MPFKSKAQQRFMFAAEARGEVPKGTAKRWAHETPDIKELPEKKGESETLQEHVFSTKAKKHRHLKEKIAQLAHAHDDGKGLDPKAIEEGAKVELEHTHDHAVARQIAIDHLREKPDYYKLLKKYVEGEKKAGWYADAQRRTNDPVSSTLSEVSDPSFVLLGPKSEDAEARRLILSTPTAKHHRRPMQLLGGLGGALMGAGLPSLLKSESLPMAAAGAAVGGLAGGYGLGKLQDASFAAPFMQAREQTRAHLAKTANFKLQGETNFNGLDIAIENKKGSKRSWFDPHGKEKGSTFMHFDYGYIRLTEGTDGDHVDCYLGPDKDAERVFIVNQMKKPPGEIKKDGKAWTEFDEQKCMLGFNSAADAKAAYLKQYDDPRFFGSMTEMSFEDFRKKVLDKKNHGKKIAKLLHTPGGGVFGGAAADSQVSFPKEANGDMAQYFMDHPEKLKEKKMRDKIKTAVSAGWIREKAVSGLAKRNIALGGKDQAQVARKAVDYARAKELGEGVSDAREGLRGILGKFKDQAPNTGRRAGRQAEQKWRPQTGPYTEAERENQRAYDAYRASRGQGGPRPMGAEAKEMAAAMGVGGAGGLLANALMQGPRSDARKLTRAANRAEKGKEVNFDRLPSEPGSIAKAVRGVGIPAGMAASLGATGFILGANPYTGRGSRFGAGLGALGGLALGYRANSQLQGVAEKQRERLEPFMPKESAISPAMLSGLQHGAVGAGIGAVAGGLGGMAHAAPGHRAEGFGRGALVGGALGAAGGAGVSAIKSHGAQQLSTLQAAAGKAHQDALAAHAIAGKTVADPALAGTQAALAGRGTAAGKAGAMGRPSGAPAPLHLDTQQKAVMSPTAWGHHQTVAPSVPHDIAQAQAASAGGRAEALRRAAETLGQQQQVLNKGINQGALAGAAAGTGLMGYMAVPRQYGGVGATPKQASDDRVSRIADRIDDVGIATLASPYIADAAAGGLKRLMLRGGRLGAVAAEGHGIAEALAHKLHHPAVELGGLALVAPGVTHNLAKGIAGKPASPPAPAMSPEVLKTAEEIGRVLANSEHILKLGGVGRLALGLGAVGAVGGGILAGKKAIDTTHRLATHHAEPAQYVGVPPGMRPPSAAGA